MNDILQRILDRLGRMERDISDVSKRSERSEITGAFSRVDFIDLPVPGKRGRVFYVNDGLKPSETPGNGTGVCAYDDGVAWVNFHDPDTAVSN